LSSSSISSGLPPVIVTSSSMNPVSGLSESRRSPVIAAAASAPSGRGVIESLPGSLISSRTAAAPAELSAGRTVAAITIGSDSMRRAR